MLLHAVPTHFDLMQMMKNPAVGIHRILACTQQKTLLKTDSFSLATIRFEIQRLNKITSNLR